MTAAASLSTLPSSLGQLRLAERLYRSRRTEVWSAHLANDARELVVKRPAPGSDLPQVVAALTREARLLRSVSSAHVVELPGWSGSLAQVDALILPRLARSLDKKRLPLPADELARHAGDVSQALRDLHAAGIVHRDLRPANILLRAEPDCERALVADLDHALRVPALERGADADGQSLPEPEPRAVVGAPGFIAPELHRGRAASATSDVYALGVTLFVLATGERPFAHPDPAVERRRASGEAALPICSYARHTPLSPSLTAAIEAALTADPNRRPSVEEFLRAAQENA